MAQPPVSRGCYCGTLVPESLGDVRPDTARIHSAIFESCGGFYREKSTGAAGLLARLVSDSLHVYLDCLPAPISEDWRDAFATLLGHQQVTDAYLLRLTAANNAVLVTFDRRLERVAGPGTKVTVLG